MLCWLCLCWVRCLLLHVWDLRWELLLLVSVTSGLLVSVLLLVVLLVSRPLGLPRKLWWHSDLWGALVVFWTGSKKRV
jgi:hypothetical protein